jgi:hypothetical protein
MPSKTGTHLVMTIQHAGKDSWSGSQGDVVSQHKIPSSCNGKTLQQYKILARAIVTKPKWCS